jgi:hypothetical protein
LRDHPDAGPELASRLTTLRRFGARSGGVRLLRPPRPVVRPPVAPNDRATEYARNALVVRGKSRVPVIVVCSARARVGRTLVARLLTEFLLADGRPAIAFDANPNDPALCEYLPQYTVLAGIGDTRSQMSLFDRLVVNDGFGKVVDVAPELTRPFFELVARLDFVEVARASAVDTLVLYLLEDHPRSADLCRALTRSFTGMTIVPVHNEAIAAAEFPRGSPALRLTMLSPLLHGVINRPGFSFAHYLHNPENAQTGLGAWIRRAFLAFRVIDLRLQLAEVERSFFAASRAAES